MPKRDTEQLLLRPSSAMVNLLEEAAARFGYNSRSEIAVEILETYFEFWEQAQISKQATIQQQRDALFGSGIYARGKPPTKAEAERVKRDARSRKK